MQNITIYTKDGCPYCVRAKALLDSKGLIYQEVNVGNDPEKRASLSQKSNGSKTVPQIFIGDRHIGGCDNLIDFNNSGNLDKLVK